jgi:CubicO group peptidase (beta-lactamase class C family)
VDDTYSFKLLQHLASLTKVVATTAVAMLLYERHQLPLDAPLAKFLPEFVSLVPRHQQAAREAVTIRMLLAHCSGLPAYEKLFQFAQSRDELIRAALTTRIQRYWIHPARRSAGAES